MRTRRQHVPALACAVIALSVPTAQAAISAPAFSLKPSMRADWDTAYLDHESKGTARGSTLRRLWLGASGKVYTLNYKATADLGGLEHRLSQGSVKMRDLWLSQQLGPGALMLGQFKQAFSLEGQTSSSVMTFIERTWAIAAFAPGYHKAIGWQMAGARSTLAASAWSLQKIGAPQFAGYGVGTRLTFAPLMNAENIRHLGLSLAHEHHDHPGTGGAPALKLRPRGGSHLSKAMRPTLASFSAGGAAEVDKWSLEYARVHGTWSWQGEFSGGLLHDGTDAAQLISEYGALSWFVSGHSRRYDAASGRFGRIQGVSTSRPGWELALRFEHIRGRQRDNYGIDHIDTETSAWTLASNWYLHPNVRLMLNLVTSFDRDHLKHTHSRTRELIARAQYDF